MSGGHGQARRQLGAALAARAGEVAYRVRQVGREQGRAYYDAADPEVAAYAEQSVLATNEVGARVMARWLDTGQGATRAELRMLARAGSDVARGRYCLADVTKNYLAWGEVTIAVLTEEAGLLGTDPVVLTEAIDMIVVSWHRSILAMVAQFDTAHQALRAALAAEQARWQHLAHHDPLTGLPNRQHLFDRLTETLTPTGPGDDPPVTAGGGPVVPPGPTGDGAVLGSSPHGTTPGVVGVRAGVFYLDVDRFKTVNDTYGHDIGDQVLRAVATRLRAHTHPSDTLARIGGDEFVVLCPHVHTTPAAETMLAQLRHHLAGPVHAASPAGVTAAGATAAEVTVSGGHTLARAGDDPVAVVAAADTAMYTTRAAERGPTPR